jgi:hypothetical protein
MRFQQFIYAKPGKDIFAGDDVRKVFIRKELTPPVKVKVKYYLSGVNFAQAGDVWKEVTISRLYPKCLQDVLGWQKPFWSIKEWKEA